MSISTLWTKNSINAKIISGYLRQHGHLLKWNNHKENILDIGCADGSLTKTVLYPYIEKHLEKLMAVDRLENMINSARKNNEIQKIDYRVVDITDKGKISEMVAMFDHIFSVNVAQWIPDNRSFLSDIHQMLKPGGQFFMTIVTDHPIVASVRRHFSEGTWSTYLKNQRLLADYTDEPRSYFRNLVEDVGFKVDMCDLERRADEIENFTDLVKALVHMTATVERIPPELQEEYVQDHIRNHYDYSKYVRKPDTYNVPCELLICIATKHT